MSNGVRAEIEKPSIVFVAVRASVLGIEALLIEIGLLRESRPRAMKAEGQIRAWNEPISSNRISGRALDDRSCGNGSNVLVSKDQTHQDGQLIRFTPCFYYAYHKAIRIILLSP